jgi:hypothetical protein
MTYFAHSHFAPSNLFISIPKSNMTNHRLDRDFERDLDRDFEGDLDRDSERDLEGDFEGDLDRDFERDLDRDFERDLEGDFEGDLDRDFDFWLFPQLASCLRGFQICVLLMIYE